MEEIPTIVVVVAAVISRPDKRILLQRCLPRKRHAGMWEFPGGKVEPGETPRQALAREIHEELGIALDPVEVDPAGFADEPGAEGRPDLVLLLYSCRAWSGEPQAREGQEWGWFTPAEATMLPLPPIDRALLAHLAGERAC